LLRHRDERNALGIEYLDDFCKISQRSGQSIDLVHDDHVNYEKDAAALAAKVLTAVHSAAKNLGVFCDTKHLSDRYPAEGIIDYAKDANCDLIVMASHGRRGLSRLLLGSEAIDVLTHSSVPVLICR
jgi:nucleotide-binding universal stress UspA family protein